MGQSDDSLVTEQIKCNLLSNPTTACFLEGVFALNELPTYRIDNRPALVVCNTDSSNSPGQHWVGFFLSENNVEFFDSYGCPPFHKLFLDFISVNGGNALHYNTRCLQGPLSSTCGKYVTTYLLFRCLGLSLNMYLSVFDGHIPDEMVRQLYNFYFKHSSKVVGQTCRALCI